MSHFVGQTLRMLATLRYSFGERVNQFFRKGDWSTLYFFAKFSHAIKVVAHGVVSYAVFTFRFHGLYSFFRNKKNTIVPDVVYD